MSDNDVNALAEAAEAPDFSIKPLPSLSTFSPWSAKHGMPGSAWASYAGGQFETAVDLGQGPGALSALGKAIHAVQDAFAHDLAGGGMWEHIKRLFGDSPDDPSAAGNKERSEAAKEATRDLIRDFMRSRGDKPTCE